MTATQEKELRKLRANTYGEIDDEAWAKVKDKWSTPENQQWLREQPQNQKVDGMRKVI